MDLISREAAIETVKKLLYETAFNSCGHHQDDEIYADIAEHRIEVWLGLVPSVPAVPLEMISTKLGSLCKPCIFQTVGCPYKSFDCDSCNTIDALEKAIRKWMEEEDAQKEN